MKLFYRLQIFAVAVIIAVAGFIPAAHGSSTKKNEIIEYCLKSASADSVQDWINGELAQNAGIGAEWYVLALSQSGNYDFAAYESALRNYVSENEVGSASTRLKHALAFVAAGSKDEPYVAETANNSIGEQGVMSLVFGLHLLNNGCNSNAYSVDALISEISALQLADGGWALSGENGDADVTAMTVQALAVYEDDATVNSALNRALDFLAARQEENGGYISYGVNNPESAAQVLVALTSLGIDAKTDGRFIKNGKTVFDAIESFRLPDGSYCHKQGGGTNSMATVQVLCAYVAYENARNGDKYFYVFENSADSPAEETPDEPETELSVTEQETKIDETEKTPEFSATTPSESDTAVAENSVANNSAPQQDSAARNKKLSARHWVAIAAAVIALAVCAVLFISKKRNPKDYIIVLLAAAVVIAVALFAKIETVDEHYSDSAVGAKDAIGTVTISITCDAIKGQADHVPQNGIILAETEIEIAENSTVYDVLAEVCAKNKIHFESNGTDKTVYIEGINNIYEADFGALAGWIYFVNGESPTVGCGDYTLADGDSVEWRYSLELV